MLSDQEKEEIREALGMDKLFVVEGNGPEYNIRIGSEEGEIVASARMVENEINLTIKNTWKGKQFAEWLERSGILKPKQDESCLWLVVFPHQGHYSYNGSPQKTQKDALAYVAPVTFLNDRKLAYLVGFKASQWPAPLALKVDHCYLLTKIGETYISDELDRGAMRFCFTDSE